MEAFKKNVDEISVSAVQGLWIPALFPLLAILASFLIGTWGWGLVDDYNLSLIHI